METIAAAVMLAMVTAAVVTDVRSGKIYNAVTAPGAVAGLALFAVRQGLPGVGLSLAGLAVGFGVFLLSGLFGRILGGGDIKLLMAIGALQGPQFLLYTMVGMALVGGVLAIGVALFNGDLMASLRRLGSGLVMRACARVPLDVAQAKPTARLPYAIPIAMGSLIALYATFYMQAA